MINVSLESIYYLVMIVGTTLGTMIAFIKWIYNLGYKHGKTQKSNHPSAKSDDYFFGE